MEPRIIEGIVFHIGETMTFGSSGFRKRELVVETQEQYPQKLSIDFVQNATDALDQIAEGEHVKVYINLRGREWVSPAGETKYFNSFQAWKIEVTEGLTATQQHLQKQQQAKKPEPKEPHAGDDFLAGNFKSKKPVQPDLADMPEDDLPF